MVEQYPSGGGGGGLGSKEDASVAVVEGMSPDDFMVALARRGRGVELRQPRARGEGCAQTPAVPYTREGSADPKDRRPEGPYPEIPKSLSLPPANPNKTRKFLEIERKQINVGNPNLTYTDVMNLLTQPSKIEELRKTAEEAGTYLEEVFNSIWQRFVPLRNTILQQSNLEGKAVVLDKILKELQAKVEKCDHEKVMIALEKIDSKLKNLPDWNERKKRGGK